MEYKGKVNRLFADSKTVACMATDHANTVLLPFSSFPSVGVAQADGSVKQMFDLPAEGQIITFEPLTPKKVRVSKAGNSWDTYALASAKCVVYEAAEESSELPEDDDDPKDDGIPF